MSLEWESIARTVVHGAATYGVLIGLLRLTGNRTLSKLNAFDLVVTIALGSVLAASFVDASVATMRAAAALGALVALQFAITWLTARSRAVGRLIKTPPSLLYDRDGYRTGAMREARVTAEEVRTAVRQAGIGGMEQVAAVILESDGTLAVIPQSALGSGSALGGVR